MKGFRDGVESAEGLGFEKACRQAEYDICVTDERRPKIEYRSVIIWLTAFVLELLRQWCAWVIGVKDFTDSGLFGIHGATRAVRQEKQRF